MAQRFTAVVEISENDVVRWRVRDNKNDILTSGRFHTEEQALAWIGQHLDKLIKASRFAPQTGMPGRARAHLITPAILALAASMVKPEAGYE